MGNILKVHCRYALQNKRTAHVSCSHAESVIFRKLYKKNNNKINKGNNSLAVN